MSSFPPTFNAQLDQAIQLGQGAAASVLGQPYDVRRLDTTTNVSVSSNAPLLHGFPVALREYKLKAAVEGMPFDLLTYAATCNNQSLLNLIETASGYGLTSIQLTETGYEAGNSGVYTLARVRPMQETLLVRTELTVSITRPFPTAGAAATMPVTPGTWLEDEGYGGTPKSTEQVLTLANGMYAFEGAGAEMATVYVGVIQQRRIKDTNPLHTPMTLPGGEFYIWIPDLPGVILKRNDRINGGDRFEIASFYNSEDTGLSGYICVCRMMGV